MKTKSSKILISLILVSVLGNPAFAESLFRIGTSQNIYMIQPRPLFSSVKAKNIGDLVTVIVNNSISSSDDVQFNTQKSSSTTDNFSNILNNILNHNTLKNVNDYGGDSQTKNQSSLTRKSTLKDTVTTQVVQIMPNGNLVIQGKKTAINSGEKVDLVVSGIVDPRMLDEQGRIDSTLVANLQVAVVGKGAVSRSDSEGTFNKIIKFLF